MTENEKSKSIYEQLMQYASGVHYPFHMPGHKRNLEWIQNPYQIDITEIDGFDDLHHAQGMLREGMQRMEASVGALKSYYLVNGSTCGLLSAIYGGCKEGAIVGIARNCHRSVYHGSILRRINPVYIYPRYVDNLGITCGLSAKSVDNLYQSHPKMAAVVLTSPSYEGIVSNIKEIAEVIHGHGGILIVDEAHGAHLPYAQNGEFPASAVSQGADIVIQSLHKTLPSLTQSAALHICSERVDCEKIEQALRIFETSSPSYVLMAGMDLCVRYMEQEGKKQLSLLSHRLDAFYRKTDRWDAFWFLMPDEKRDKSKIVFGAKYLQGMGRKLHERLVERYHLQPEMSTPDYVLLMTMLTDREEGFVRLEQALDEMNIWLKEEAAEKKEREDTKGRRPLPEAQMEMPPWQAVQASAEAVSIEQAEGCVCGETVYIYPPGCPFLMPGEIIAAEHISLMRYYKEHGVELYALKDETAQTIQVINRRKQDGKE